MTSRPFVTLKLATSLDGKIALANGESEWITSEASRETGRRLRGTHDAIAVGANTATLDNPQLTTRIEGLPDPVRVIFDSNLRILKDSNLVKTAEKTPLWVFSKSDKSDKARSLIGSGVIVLPVKESDGLDVFEALDILFRRDIKTLLLEGGGMLTSSFLKADAIDRIEWFRAPIILGGDGRNGVGDLGLENLNLAHTFRRINVSPSGADLHEIYERVA